MPVLPLVGSMITVSLRQHAALLRVLDHRHADAVLHAAERIEKLALQRDRVPGRARLAGMRLSFTSGVRPTVSTMLLINFAHGDGLYVSVRKGLLFYHAPRHLGKGDVSCCTRTCSEFARLQLTRFASATSHHSNSTITPMADLLNTQDIKDWLKKLPEWDLEKKHIERTLRVRRFLAGDRFRERRRRNRGGR